MLSIIMADDDDNDSMSFNIDGSPSRKKRNIERLDPERLRTLVGINYVRVNNVIFDDDDKKIIERYKIDNEEFQPSLMGTVIVTDCGGDNLVYHRYDRLYRDSLRLGEEIKLSGPTRPLSAHDTFIISLVFWVSFYNPDPRSGEVIKEIARGDIVWDPSPTHDLPLQHDLVGKYGSVSVGYSVITKALSTTVDVVWMNESPAEIYGTIKAVRSSTRLILFNEPANAWVARVMPRQSMFYYQFRDYPLSFPFPVPVDSYLTIEVALWDHLSCDNQIALGTLIFTPKVGTDKRNIGGVQVSVTFE